jgi:hypothetical protein
METFRAMRYVQVDNDEVPLNLGYALHNWTMMSCLRSFLSSGSAQYAWVILVRSFLYPSRYSMNSGFNAGDGQLQ